MATLTRTMRTLFCRAFAAILSVLCACNTDVPVTAERDRSIRESENSYTIYDWQVLDLALVVEPAEREQARPLVRELLRELITGDANGDGVVDHHAEARVRVAVLSEAQLSAFTEPYPDARGFVISSCVKDGSCEPPEARSMYEWQPYDYAPPVETYLDVVDCLLMSDDPTCGPAQDTRTWTMFSQLVMPVTLADMEGPRETLVRKLQDCGLQIDASRDRSLNDVAFDEEGLARCTITETLPTFGPITRCEQLSAWGRTYLREDNAGREVCEIAQLATDPDGTPASGHGFYLYDGDTPSHEGAFKAPTASPEFPNACGVYFSPGRYLLQAPNTPFVWGSEITERCTLATTDQP